MVLLTILNPELPNPIFYSLKTAKLMPQLAFTLFKTGGDILYVSYLKCYQLNETQR